MSVPNSILLQATYKLLDDGTFEPRFLSCFAGTFVCRDDSKCMLELVQPDKNLYYCCCNKNYCNGHGVLVFPNVPPPGNGTVGTPGISIPTSSPKSGSSEVPSETNTGERRGSTCALSTETYMSCFNPPLAD